MVLPSSDEDRGVPQGGASDASSLVEQLLGALRRYEQASKPILTSEDVAGWLGVTPRAVRDMMDRGEIPWTVLGRRRVVVREQFVSVLAKRAEKNVSAEGRP